MLYIKNLAFKVGILSIVSFGTSITSATPSLAALIDFSDSSWTKFGDVATPSTGQVNLSTDARNNDDNPLASGTFNYSSNSAGAIPSPYNLLFTLAGINATQGSGITKNITVQANDVLSFNWNFLTNDTTNNDSAFVYIGATQSLSNLNPLASASTTLPISNSNPPFPRQTGVQSFSYTFPAAGNYDIAFGVVDINDNIRSSGLQITNANLEPVPEPISILGSIVALGSGATLRRRFGRKA